MKTATTILVFSVGVLLALGMVMLYSASTVQEGAGVLKKQLLWALIGVGTGVVATCFRVRWLRDKAWLRWTLIAVSLVALGAVLIPGIGKVAGGARRWFDFGFARFQPSELAKVAVIVFLAWYGNVYLKSMKEFKRGFLYPCLAFGAVMALIFKEPDWGTALLIGMVSAGMLVVAGTRLRYLIPTAVLGMGLLAVAISHDAMRRERFLAFMNPEEYKDTVGYQQWQALLALGAGGVEGKGLGDGRQKLGFVPEHHTDFILSVIGEELGLIASLTVLAGFVAILFAGGYIARHARDPFSQLLASGITLLITLQAAINIAVVTSSMPNKGISLPFISYGGSNLVVMLGCVGLLLSVARESAAQSAPAKQAVEHGNEVFFPQFS